MAVVGIDLGTTYSAVAKLDELGKPEILPSREGNNTTPSVVFFEYEHSVSVGEAAKQSAESDPEKVVQFAKNYMGRSHTWEYFGTTYHPEEMSALILTKLKQDAEEHLGEEVTGAVITVPAIFGEGERQATVEAAKIAGLEVISILDEPVAAALSYGLGRAGTAKDNQNILIFDLGGGTFDITVMTMTENRIRVLQTDGDRMLGGRQWDDALIQYVAGCFQQQHGSDPLTKPETLQDLRNRVEQTKKILSQKEKHTVICNHDGKALAVEVTREKFEELTADLLERTKTIVEMVMRELIEDEKLNGWQDIHQILLVGGSSKMPQVPKMIQQLTGKEPKLHEPDLAVAKGAALYAVIKLVIESEKTGDKSKLEENGIDSLAVARLGKKEVQNSSSFALGVKSLDEVTNEDINAVVVKKGTPLPTTATRPFKTVEANQTVVSLPILEGDAPDPGDCIALGEGRIIGIPLGLPKGAPLEVTIEMTDEKLIRVTAVETTHNTKCNFELKRESKDNIDISKAKEGLAAIKVE